MPTPKTPPDHGPLDPFVGRWRAEGRNAGAAPDAPDTPVTGEERYEWMTGGFFLVYHWDRHFGDGRHTGTGYIDGKTAEFFDNLGFHRTYQVQIGDGTLTLAGQWERAEIAVRDGAMTVRWERSDDGARWQPLCDLTASRIG